MNVGVMVPHMGRNASADSIRDIAQAAEELGCTSIWTADHVVFPKEQISRYPFSDDGEFPVPPENPFLEPFVTMGFLAGVTERARLGIGVCVVPHRHALLLAKMIATLDHLSNGRIIFGAGVGWLREEIEALGADFTTRGRLTDETLDFLNQAYAGDTLASYDGQVLQVPDVHVSPQLHEHRELDIWIGGVSKPALRRTAQFASTWFPHIYGAEPDAIKRSMESIAQQREKFGRPGPTGLALFLPIAVTDEPSTDDTPVWRTWTVRGTVDQIKKVVDDYAALGFTDVMLIGGGRMADRIKHLEALADAGVIPPPARPRSLNAR